MWQTLKDRKKKDVVKMHWSSEWAEQHYDISSTTSPPAHPKPLSYPQAGHPAFSGYSDDISALSASTLLKRYAERYSFSSVYPEPATFRRNEPGQDAWSMGYSSEGVDGIKSSLTTTSNISDQISTGALSQDYTSSYSGPHYPRPTYLPQPAFALPPTYSAPAPVYPYPPSLSTPTSPSLLPSGLHPPLSSGLPSNQGLKRSEDFQEAPNHRTFGFDQSKSAKISPYTVRDSRDQPPSSGMSNDSADLQNFRPDRLLPQPDLKVDLGRKSSYLHPLENPSYGGPDQYTYP